MSSFEGMDEEMSVEETTGIVPLEHKKKRIPFHIWKVKGTDYKMKLTTRMISALEKKYKTNILNILSADGLPPLSVMLTTIHAALIPWEHGIKYENVQEIYDSWLEEGGSQMGLLSDVIMPTMVVSGFFTEKQGEEIMNGLKDSEELS